MGCLWDSSNQLMGYNGDNKGYNDIRGGLKDIDIIYIYNDILWIDFAIYNDPPAKNWKRCAQYPQDMGRIWQNLFHVCRSSTFVP
jgi:hypothetical protein